MLTLTNERPGPGRILDPIRTIAKRLSFVRNQMLTEMRPGPGRILNSR